MFSYLQIFVIISLLAVTGLAAVGGIFLRDVAIDNLVHLVSANNSSLAQGYVNAVWKKYRDDIAPISDDPTRLKDNPQVAQFAQDTLHYFQQMPLVRVNVYSGKGLLLMTDNVSTSDKILGNSASPDKAFVMAQLKNEKGSNSHVLQDVRLQSNEHGKIVQTLLPFHMGDTAGQPPEAALEILFDVTELWNRFISFQIIGTTSVVGVFICFLFILSVSSKKAESIIAKQHEANLELIEAAAAAQAENQDKSQFLTNISHELRTPLNAIIGFSEIIKNELLPKLTERKYDQYVGDINAAGVHLLSLINDILDYSKAEAGKLVLEVSEVDVTKMVQNSMRLVGPRSETGNVKLVEEMPKEHIIMMIDGRKFKQVLLNLLSNAVKFTPAGGFVAVTAWANMMDDTVTFVVRDTGIGIAPKDISRAMSPFGQVDNTLKRKYEGTGLGLPLTKKFVELMGGKFNIESQINKGTKVIFTLPRKTVEREGITVKQVS